MLLFTSPIATAPLLPVPRSHSGCLFSSTVTSALPCCRFNMRWLGWHGTPHPAALSHLSLQHTFHIKARPAPSTATMPLSTLWHAEASLEEAPWPRCSAVSQTWPGLQQDDSGGHENMVGQVVPAHTHKQFIFCCAIKLLYCHLYITSYN